MALQTTGEVSVGVDRATAFGFVENPQKLAQCIPGCREVREIAPGRFSALLGTQVGFITVSFKVTVEIVNIDRPNAIDAKITGDAVGLAGRLAAKAGLQLTEVDGGTRIRYIADASLAGKLGGLGEPVFRAKSAELARQFAANLKAAIEAEPKATHA